MDLLHVKLPVDPLIFVWAVRLSHILRSKQHLVSWLYEDVDSHVMGHAGVVCTAMAHGLVVH